MMLPHATPRLLDLFCGPGGGAMGYHLAGFTVTGVDIHPQPHYPFPFIRDDALNILTDVDYLEGFAAIHASPPCQAFARATAWRGNREKHPDLLAPTLDRLYVSRRPWVVENVPEAVWAGTLRGDLTLCGTQFDLPLRRHRAFQCGNWPAPAPPTRHTCYRNPGLLPFMHKGERAFADAMGCHWMSNIEARQAIPPEYTRFIGTKLIDHFIAQER